MSAMPSEAKPECANEQRIFYMTLSGSQVGTVRVGPLVTRALGRFAPSFRQIEAVLSSVHCADS
jgi:hypothetical protein